MRIKERVCVTGGSGGIGRALLAQLVDRYEVRALFRSNTAAEAWRARGCTIVQGDLADEAALDELVKGSTYVFHCAALTAQAKYEDSYAVNVDGTRRLAMAAARASCSRFIHVSTIAVYTAATTDSDYTEDLELRWHPEMPTYAQTKLAGEQALLDVARTSGLDYTILRPTSVYGPYTKPYTIATLELVKKGIPVILGEGTGLMDVVYVDDVATAMIQAAAAAGASGQAFNIGFEAVTLNEYYKYFGEMLNRPVRHMPVSVLRGIVKLLKSAPGAAKPARDQLRRGVNHLLEVAGNTKRFPAAKAAEHFGYAPQTSLPIGMLQTELWAKRELGVPRNVHSIAGYGTLPFRPMAVFHPTSEEEIVQAIRIAAAKDLKVKAVGSLHSFSQIPHTDGICLVLDRYRETVRVNGWLFTVQAGMQVRELFDLVAAAGLAVPTSGSITEQTVSGAISTATHGGSIVYGSLSDCVEAIRMVRADGTVAELHRGEDVFAAAVASFGLLGTISTVTFKCVPATVLQARSAVRSAQEVIDCFDLIQRQSPHTCICYFPVVDQMEILSIDSPSNATLAVEERTAPSAGPLVRRTKTPLQRRLASLALNAFAVIVGRSRPLQRAFAQRSVGTTYPLRTGRSDRVLAISDEPATCARSPQLLHDMEVAVPYQQASQAIAALRDHFRRTNRFPLLSIHIRCSASSDLWLSPAYGRAVCYLEFWKVTPHDDLFDRVHGVLAPFGYRFHWGKETCADRAYIAGQYPRWDDFVRLRASWDPNGLFLNDYTNSYFAADSSYSAALSKRSAM